MRLRRDYFLERYRLLALIALRREEIRRKQREGPSRALVRRALRLPQFVFLRVCVHAAPQRFHKGRVAPFQLHIVEVNGINQAFREKPFPQRCDFY